MTIRRSTGTKIQVRTITGVDGIKASYTHGTSNSQLVFTAKAAGVAGNSASVILVDAGAGNPTTVSVAGQEITVSLRNSAGIVATANEVIAAIYETATAAAIIDATNGAGNGSGIVTVLVETFLAGGTDSTSTFTDIPGLGDITLPDAVTELIDVTSHSSPAVSGVVYAEYAQSKVVDPPEMEIPMMWWDNANTTHALLRSLRLAGTSEKFRIRFADGEGGDSEWAAIVRSVPRNMPVKGVTTASITLKFTGAPTAI